MLNKCTFKLHTINQKQVLDIWPFGFCDLLSFFPKLFPRPVGFIAVRHPRWHDGFHPPPQCIVGGKAKPSKKIVEVRGNSTITKVLERCVAKHIVDFKIFVTPKPVTGKDGLKTILNCFETREDNLSLAAFGGCWIHLHDGEKTYLSTLNGSAAFPLYIKYIIEPGYRDFRLMEAAEIYKTLLKLPKQNSLCVSWGHNYLKVNEIKAAVSLYEDYGRLQRC